MTEPTHAVIYAAKSTEDKHGSIPTQIKDCEDLAERERWTVVGTEQDEAFSAYHGNRGPGLEKAKALAVATAAEHGECVLVAQDADRFARGAGDAPGAADHLGEVYFAMKRQRVALWTVRSGRLDLLRAAIEGERANDESARKTQSIRAGLARRKASGKPVGSMPFGYRVAKTVIDGDVVTRRVVDAATAPTVERIFREIERGASPGAVAKRLNQDGIKTKRGKTWESRAVQRIAENPLYGGDGAYPALIDPEQAARTRACLTRLDPTATQRQKGGRAPVDDSFILRGIARCGTCGSAMWVRRGDGARPVYLCRHRRQSTGVCDALPVPARAVEEHVLAHLTGFVGDTEAWALEQIRDHEQDRESRQRALDQLGREAAKLDRTRARVHDDYTAAIAEDDPKARHVLEALDRLDGQATGLARQIADAEASLSEWEEASEDEALALLRGLVDVVQGRVTEAKGTAALHDALASVLAGIWVSYDGRRLDAEFRMAEHVTAPTETGRQRIAYLLQHMTPGDPRGPTPERFTLPGQPRHTPRSIAV